MSNSATDAAQRPTGERRDLSFASLDELSAELDRLESAHRDGRLRAVGRWTPGQIFQHCGKLIGFALDGFPFRASLAMRLAGPVMKRFVLGSRPLPTGVPIQKESSALLPDDDVSFEEGLASLRQQVDRLKRGERMEQPSPVFGAMTHEQWMTMQLKHCALHLSHLHVDPERD